MSIIYILQAKSEFEFHEHLCSLYPVINNQQNKEILKKIIVVSNMDLSNSQKGNIWTYIFKNNFTHIEFEYNNSYFNNFNFEQGVDLYYFFINDNIILNSNDIFETYLNIYKNTPNNTMILSVINMNIIFLHSKCIYTLISTLKSGQYFNNIVKMPSENFSYIRTGKKKLIALHTNHFSIRGSEIALYDYACYISVILQHNVIILIPRNHKEHVHPNTGLTYDYDIDQKFSQSFPVIEYENLNDTLNDVGADIFYTLKSGENDNLLGENILNCVHCIFQCTSENKHGDVYACISENINKCQAPVVPHICHNLPEINEKMYEEDCKYVFGCYGGYESFDIEFVHIIIKKIVESRDDIRFIFMNIKQFIDHPNVKFFDKTTDLFEKSKFINSCDAMLHGRSIGESFGMAIAEFTSLGKPIITWKHDGNPNYNEDLHHINVLQDTGIYYKDIDSLYEILTNFSQYKKTPTKYSEIFTPNNVMDKFNKFFIEPCKDKPIVINKEIPNGITCKYKIKILCNWTSTEQIHKDWKKLLGDYPLEFCEENPDIWVIINKPPDNVKYEKKRTIVLGMEPDTFFGDRWDWYGNKKDYLYFMDENYRSNTEWWLNSDLLSLEENSPDKTKERVISSVVSSQYIYEGHKLRIDFLKEAEKELDFEIYGWDNKHSFKSYVKKLENGKEEGLFPYKYTFIAENVSKENFCTEKFTDAILSECLVFYWGCTNINDFFDPLCYIKLDIKDINKSIRKIRHAIMSDQWEKRIEIIRKMKHNILRKYSFAPRILGLIEVLKLEKRTINLEKRIEKWENHQKLCQESQLYNIGRYNAVDGRNVDLSNINIPFTLNINFTGPNKNIDGIIGCAISHYNLWIETVRLDKNMLIMEDDVILCDQFVDRLGNVMNDVRDVLFIGFHDHEYNLKYNNLSDDFLTEKFNKHDIVSFDFIKSYGKSSKDMVGLTGGGTFGYLISPKGALKLLNLVQFYSFYFPVDYFMLECGLNFDVELDFIPHRLLISPKFGIDTDESDIQI